MIVDIIFGIALLSFVHAAGAKVWNAGALASKAGQESEIGVFVAANNRTNTMLIVSTAVMYICHTFF